jgi:hypothetical protein
MLDFSPNKISFRIPFTAMKDSTPTNGLALYTGSRMCHVGPGVYHDLGLDHSCAIHCSPCTKMAGRHAAAWFDERPRFLRLPLCVWAFSYLLSDQLRNERILKDHRWCFGCSLILQLGLIRFYHQKNATCKPKQPKRVCLSIYLQTLNVNSISHMVDTIWRTPLDVQSIWIVNEKNWLQQ